MSITATGAQVERRHASQAAKPDGRATVSTDGSSSGWPDRGGTRFAMSARVRRDAVQHAARESVIAGTLADHTRLDPGLVRRADRCKL
jgi:hypothetical protein